MKDQQADSDGPNGREIKLGVLNDFVGMYLRAAYEAAFTDFADRLGEDRLRPGYFTILTLIVNNPGISQTEIGRTARRDKSSVAKALRWMEDNGLVTRLRPNHDRRTHLSEATEEGYALQRRMEARGREHLAALNATIGSDRREAFIETLREIVERLPEAGSSD
ncbi:hypothetical protein BOO69_08960 [Sulfitobacter alexandrii]|uniref:HTH marR-type domain-containing protein n=1 Tax=Sulfitobacter alexandrii TaxID=1917485 RepID=A0A1J0WGR7_9RHOB|nr:MarR family transcriptional regulator [Sulfitobacter alexandrii]APE43525.1 hypothetical protein BOO69_08960 [Sulfitobacter alexandrii]